MVIKRRWFLVRKVKHKQCNRVQLIALSRIEVNNMNMLSFYHRFVYDTITIQSSLTAAEDFLYTLNNCHSSLNFTMECDDGGKLPFVEMETIRKENHLETKVQVKPTNNGLLLHHQSHVDRSYKRSPVNAMLNQALRLSCHGNILLRNMSV